MSDESLKQLRRYKEENRALKKLVKKLSRGNHRLEFLEEAIKDVEVSEPESLKCSKCRKGPVTEIQLGSIRRILVCEHCNNREVIKTSGRKK